MPLTRWETKADWDALYEVPEPWGHPADREPVYFGYARAIFSPASRYAASQLVRLFAWPSETRILILGCGFGWTVEALEELGYVNVLGVDDSAYVQSAKNESDEAEIDERVRRAGLDPATGEGLRVKRLAHTDGPRSRARRGVCALLPTTSSGRARCTEQLGGIPDVIVTEYLIEHFTDDELRDLTPLWRAYCPNLVHLVPVEGAEYNVKSLTDWKKLFPMDRFVSPGFEMVV